MAANLDKFSLSDYGKMRPNPINNSDSVSLMHGARLRRICEIQLYLLIFALPFEYYFDRQQPLLTTLKIQIAAVILTWILLKAIEFPRAPDSANAALRGLVPRRLLLAVVGFALVQIFAAMLAPEFRSNALKFAVKTCIGVILAVIASDLSSCRNPGIWKFTDVRVNAIAAAALAGVTMALLGFGDWAGFKVFSSIVTIFEPTKYFLGDSVRFVSTMEYPNTAASFMSISLCAILSLIVFRVSTQNRNPWYRASILVPIVILGIAISLTYSRGASAATLIAVVCATWVWKARLQGAYSWAAVGLCLAVLIAGVWPSYLARRAATFFVPPSQKRIAYYGWDANAPTKRLSPGKTYEESIIVQNNSDSSWRRGEFGLVYRWYSVKNNRNSLLEIAAEFQADISPKQRARVNVSYKTPSEEGEYLLILFVFNRRDPIHELEDSYSPGIMCIVSAGMGKTEEAFSPKAQQYMGAIGEERRTLSKGLVPKRRDLWLAALRMFRNRPLVGMGPDNFRLLKRKYMEVPEGDETILANSLYLELLSGSGILGLLSFLWMIWELGRLIISQRPGNLSNADVTTAYFGTAYLTAWMAHGMVDYFFKFTPTFVFFWLLLGSLNFRSGMKGASDANRL